MAKHRTRVGLNGRNATSFTDADYALVRRARIETMRMMSLTDAGVYARLRRDSPGIELIVRLYDDRFGTGSRPSPAEFVGRMVPIIKNLKPYATKFEIHNEPNHADGIEGWGPSDANAKSFKAWYLKVLRALKAHCPWAKFGFPGLALNFPHRDMEWLAICKDAVKASDWLGCHCYWQYDNMLHKDWGLRFKKYYRLFPGKRIEITEFGNSTPDLPAGDIAKQYATYYQELNKYPYLGSACAFISSSPDPAWARFTWAKESGELLPVVEAVGTMERKAVTVIVKRTFPQTGKTVRGSFLQFFNRYGLAVCGYPITDQLTEDGLPAQYFARLALEEVKPGKIRVKQAASEAWKSRKAISALEDQVEELRNQPGFNLPDLIGDLSRLVAAVSAQITALSQQAAREEVSGDLPLDDAAASALTLREQVKSLRKIHDQLRAELSDALQAQREAQTELIEYLRTRIEALREELQELREPPPPPEPSAPAVDRPTIAYVADRLPKHEAETYPTRARTEIEDLIVHHSAAPATVGAEKIAAYHIRKWEWPGIGYHFVVAADGAISQTNDLETVSNHAAAANPKSIGICFLGDFMVEPPPPEQLAAGAHLVAWLLFELGLSRSSIKGHREVMQTNCPGNQWLTGKNWKDLLMGEIDRVQGQAEEQSSDEAAKPIFHYLLLPSLDGQSDTDAWRDAQQYVAAFQPSVGFKTSDAVQAEYVSLAGGPKRIAPSIEHWLDVHGCLVERIAGEEESDTGRLLDEMAKQGNRFLKFEE